MNEIPEIVIDDVLLWEIEDEQLIMKLELLERELKMMEVEDESKLLN